MGLVQKSLLPVKLHLLVASLSNIVENLLLSPATETKTTKVKEGGVETPEFKLFSSGKSEIDPRRPLGVPSHLRFSLYVTDRTVNQTNPLSEQGWLKAVPGV